MKTHLSTLWIVTDLETAEGRLLAYNALRHLKRSHTMRVAMINNPKDLSFSAQYNFCSRVTKYLSSMKTDFYRCISCHFKSYCKWFSDINGVNV